MCRALLVCLPFALFACAGGTDGDGQSDDQAITSAARKAGETCGGIAGLRCAAGLDCQMSGAAHPDQSGVCTPSPPSVNCHAIPACTSGTVQVDTCDKGDKDCSTVSVCGHSISCTKPQLQCQAIPACASGTVEVDKCDKADKDCTTVSTCGHTISCTKPQLQCQAIPSCSSGTVEVDKCDAGDKDCSPISLCGHSIFCQKK
jgi:hypothetical protein